MDETSWVSSNRRKAFPGPSGDDGLGFDFKVGSGKRPMMFEVKATRGDGGQIELGESEVRAAQQHAGNERWRLLVVTSVLDPERVDIHMLPNPFGKQGRGRYREEGGALRFSYRL
ncbi:protein NO VEIN domain-containing protein [Streptomyces plumbiresistens]